MPTVALLSSATKTRNSSIMDADPAIMEAGKNAHSTGVNNNDINGDNDVVGGKAGNNIISKVKSNSTLINRMKSRSLKMRGLKTKTFFRTDRSFAAAASKIPVLSTGDSVAQRAVDSTVNSAVASQSTLKSVDSDADLSSSKSDTSSTTIDEDNDSLSSNPSSSELPFRKSWSSKTKAMFSTGNKISAAVAAVKKARLNTGSTSSFDAVTKLDSTTSSSVMDVTSNSSSEGGCGEVMNFDMSMSSGNGSDASVGESLGSEFGRVLQLNGNMKTSNPASMTTTVDSPHNTMSARSVIAALNAPKPTEPNRGNQRMPSVDDVFEDAAPAAGGRHEGGGEVRGESSAKASTFDAGLLKKSGSAVNLGAVEMLYSKEIFSYFMKIQAEFQATIPFPASLGTLARGDTRAILISWIVQVHDYEDLENESLYLTVRITDTYCSVHDVVLSEIQLVGIAAIFIASKQEERFPPEGKDLVRYTNNAYTIQDLYKMELQILGKLKFKVNMPICWTFASYLLALQSKERPREVDWMTCYLLELSLLSKPLIVVLPSLIASAAVYMARFLFLDDGCGGEAFEDPWPASLSGPSTHSVANMRPVVGELLALLQSTPNSKFNASFVKFSSESKFRGLSKLPILHNSFSLKRLAISCSLGGAGSVVTSNADPPA